MTRRCATILGALSLLLAGAGMAGGTTAAPTFTASLSPIKLNARPGQVLTSEFRLTTQAGDSRAQFKVDVQDWWRSVDGTQSFYATAGSLPRSCGPWVTVNPGEAAISGGETLVVRATVTVPSSVQPGGYWCALTVDEVPDPLTASSDGVSVRFLASVANGIYIYVDPVERDATILNVDITAAEAVVHLENVGNTPIGVEGRVEFFKKGTEEPVATALLPRNTLLTAPFALGQFAAPLPNAEELPSGTYTVRVLIDIGVDHYLGLQREVEVVRTATGSP